MCHNPVGLHACYKDSFMYFCLFIVYLITQSKSSVASNVRMISKRWIEEDVEGSGHDLR
jgi:hypothetical protein